MADPIPFVRPVDLSGRGPFVLPKMQAVMSVGEGSWDTPIVRLQTEQGAEVRIPLTAEALVALHALTQGWLGLPQNPLNSLERP
jgi:hypothetical protein